MKKKEGARCDKHSDEDEAEGREGGGENERLCQAEDGENKEKRRRRREKAWCNWSSAAGTWKLDVMSGELVRAVDPCEGSGGNYREEMHSAAASLSTAERNQENFWRWADRAPDKRKTSGAVRKRLKELRHQHLVTIPFDKHVTCSESQAARPRAPSGGDALITEFTSSHFTDSFTVRGRDASGRSEGGRGGGEEEVKSVSVARGFDSLSSPGHDFTVRRVCRAATFGSMSFNVPEVHHGNTLVTSAAATSVVNGAAPASRRSSLLVFTPRDEEELLRYNISILMARLRCTDVTVISDIVFSRSAAQGDDPPKRLAGHQQVLGDTLSHVQRTELRFSSANSEVEVR
ncbi:unnamed protein product [Pleuronectes platessa]|uniref:Uncharacterized protein n=1 Tax=Pleuronectes platessa TaxID=8262 RepID=A0A9N7UFE3_PLEPL|nr:unnamed protein product [Pleuronectes platessa]